MVLSNLINNLANPNGGIVAPGRRRRLFIPPSTNYPLFSYGEGDDQRSFLSLIHNGSVVESEVSDNASISTSRSLPSTLNSVQTSEDQESFHSWLLEERQRKYSATASEEDEPGGVGSDEYESIASKSSRYSSLVSSYNKWDDFVNLKTSYNIELRVLLRYSCPLILTFIFEHIFSVVCLLVVGHLGKNELAAVSLASMTSTVTFAIFEGIATALDTLCPQAYGAQNFELVSIHVQRCTAFSFTVFVPFGMMWWYSSEILQFIVHDEQVLNLTASFLRILVLGAPPYIFFENSKRFLQAQGIFEAGTGVLFVTAPINIFLSWFLVWNEKFGLGYIGAPIAIVINFWLEAVLIVMYVIFVDGDKCWFGVASIKELFSQWPHLSKLAFPGIIMLESEYMAYEIMTLFASYFGTVELAAQTTVSTIASLTYSVPLAVGIAASTRIANFIGGQNISSAKLATKSGMIAAVFISTIDCLFLFTFKEQIAHLFTQDEEVITLIIHLFNPLVSIIQIFDGIACVASGILRAQGAQSIGGLLNFFVYYAFAIPLALVLSKVAKLRLTGLWLGIGSGMLLIGLSETIVIFTSNWENILSIAATINVVD